MSAADSMAVTVVRTARSAVVKAGMDFSTAVFNAAGEQVAQGLTPPFHMGAMQPLRNRRRRERGPLASEPRVLRPTDGRPVHQGGRGG